MPDDRAAMDRVGRYWDGLVSGEAADVALEPDLATTIQRLQGFAAQPPAGARERVWKEVLANVEPRQAQQEQPMLHAISTDALQFPTIGPIGRETAPRRSPWALAQLATAALVLLTLAGSFFVFGRGRLGHQEDRPVHIPAISATPATPDPAETPVSELVWTATGGPDSPLLAPGYLALDPAGNLWVPDSGNDRFQVFAPDGTFLETWGETGSGEGQFEFALGGLDSSSLAFAPDGSFYVVDSGNQRIQKFAPDRAFATAWGEDGTGPGQFKTLNGIAVDGEGRVYVTDDGRHDVQVFAADGAYLRTIGERGFGDGQFLFTAGSAVAIDPAGNVLVSDTGNYRIQTFSPDGAFVSMLRGGQAAEQVGQANQVAVDAAGRLFVTAPDRRQVQIVAPHGSLVASWGSADRAAQADPVLEAEEFLAPVGIALDGQGGVYVADYARNTVQKFSLLPSLTPEASPSTATPEAAAEQPIAEWLWASDGGPDYTFQEPNHPVIDPQGNIWIPDGWNSRFVIYAPDGTLLEAWGTEGSGDGEFLFESGGIGFGGVAFDGAGNIYVADSGNHRVQKFAPDRTFLTAWGSEGFEDGQMRSPVALAVDNRGRVYVSDRGSGEIHVFAGDSALLSSSGSPWLASWDGLGAPVGITVDANGDVWVADEGLGEVLKFSPAGERLATWRNPGGNNGQLLSPSGVAIDASGRIYVSDRGNRVQIFTPDGEFLGKWGIAGSEVGKINGPYGVVVDASGTAYIAEDFGRRVQAFRLLPPFAPDRVSSAATPEAAESPVAEFVWQSEGDPALPLADPVRVALDPEGNVWVTDGGNSRFQIFSPDGEFLAAWGEEGSAPGRFDFVDPSMFGGYGGGSMAFDSAGNVYVLDPANHRVQKFGPDRTFLAAWGSKGTGDGQFMAPTDLVIDGEGRIYVTDEGTGRDDVQVFDSDGRFLSTWGDIDQGWLTQPSGITVDAEGNLWIAHFNSNRVQKYAPDGTLLATIGEYGTGPGQFRNPSDVATDEQGSLYVADWGASQIQVFDAEEEFLGFVGQFGLGDGQFIGPNIAVPDGLGNVYVAEDGNDRVQKFRLLPPLAPAAAAAPTVDLATTAQTAEMFWETRGPSDQPMDHPGLLAIGPDGNLWIPHVPTNQIQIFGPDGTFLEAWGTPGNGEGQFDFTWDEEQISGGAVAFDAAGNIYVTEKGNHRVQKFAPDRSFLLVLGGEGTGEGQFVVPDSIAIDGQGQVYVADGERDDIQVFDAEGNYLSTIGEFGFGDGQFYFFCGSGMAFAPNGELLVTDACNHRMQRFSPEGEYLATIGGVGPEEGRFNQPQQIALDDAGRIYVADYSNRRVQVFAADGTYLAQWGQEGLGPIYGPIGIVVDGGGHAYVGDVDEDRLIAFGVSLPAG